MSMSVNGSQASNASTPLHGTQKGQIGIPKNPDAEFTLISQDPGNTLVKPGLSVGLPPPPPLTLASTTMTHLGSLGDNQTSADITTFMALFQKMAQQMRDTARTQRSADMQAQVTALKGAASQMKDAAQSRFTAAMVQGGLQIAGGAAQMGFSALSAKNLAKSSSLDTPGQKMLAESKNYGSEMGNVRRAELRADGTDLIAQGAGFKALGDKYGAYSQGSSGIASGLGGIIGAGFNLEAGLADARRSELEADAKVFETGVQHANDTMQQMMDVIRDVRDKLQSIQQSAIETNRGIARNI